LWKTNRDVVVAALAVFFEDVARSSPDEGYQPTSLAAILTICHSGYLFARCCPHVSRLVLKTLDLKPVIAE